MTAKKASVTVASLLFAGLAFGASTETAEAGHRGCYSYGYAYAPPVYVAPPVYYPPPVYYHPAPVYYAPRYSYRSYGGYYGHRHHRHHGRSFSFGFGYSH